MKGITRQDVEDSLMLSAVGCLPEGKTERTMMKAVHTMAIIPMGIHHLPSENGPG